jgi:hypothetical protein
MQITGPAKFWHYYQRDWATIIKIHKNSSSWIKKIGQKAKKITFRPGKPREKHNVVNTYQSYAIKTLNFRPTSHILIMKKIRRGFFLLPAPGLEPGSAAHAN